MPASPWWLTPDELGDGSGQNLDEWGATARAAIDDAVGAIEDYISNPGLVKEDNVTITVYANGDSFLLAGRPIRNLISVTSPTGPMTVPADCVDTQTGWITHPVSVWPPGRYTLVADAGFATCPRGLKAVVRGLAQRRMDNPSGLMGTFRDPQFPASDSVSALTLSMQEKRSLDRYKIDGFG
jgi:hypothetical protein